MRALAEIDDKNAKDNAKRDERFADNAMAIASLVFEDNKAISAGIAFVNTAQGVTKALASQDYSGAALTAVVGAAQISSILGASKGGGGSVSAPAAPAQASQQDFQADTTGLDVGISTAGGSQEIRVVMVDGSGNDLVTFISEAQQDNLERGQ